ncbi:putative immunity protein [Lacticaseibacillus daqingensis]|uniref:putative immunity protein n=1 Tax=Lacticaseibacillus daqingensis TaxID=2486014 RepID=UPI000F7717E5|nr:hypothetical protein [Lacticaseibacillus daqingensis]
MTSVKLDLTNATTAQPELRQATAWALPFVEAVLPLLAAAPAALARAQEAVAVARQYAQGAPRGQALRAAAMAVFKQGKTVPPAAKFVTKAACALDAMAYTHMDLAAGAPGALQAQHLLGPIVYSAYALELATGDPTQAEQLLDQAVAAAPPVVAVLVGHFAPQPDPPNRVGQLMAMLDRALRADQK